MSLMKHFSVWDIYMYRSLNRPYTHRYGLMVIEKNMVEAYSKITCGYVFMNIKDRDDSHMFLFDYTTIAS